MMNIDITKGGSVAIHNVSTAYIHNCFEHGDVGESSFCSLVLDISTVSTRIKKEHGGESNCLFDLYFNNKDELKEFASSLTIGLQKAIEHLDEKAAKARSPKPSGPLSSEQWDEMDEIASNIG